MLLIVRPCPRPPRFHPLLFARRPRCGHGSHVGGGGSGQGGSRRSGGGGTGIGAGGGASAGSGGGSPAATAGDGSSAAAGGGDSAAATAGGGGSTASSSCGGGGGCVNGRGVGGCTSSFESCSKKSCIFHLNQHDREYRNKVQGFSFYLFLSQQAKCTIWRVSSFYT